MRNNPPGTIQAAVFEAYRAAGGLEAVKQMLGLGLSTLSQATEENDDRPGGLGVNYLDRLAHICPPTAAPLARHFAHLGGGVFQPVVTDARVVCLSEQSGLIAKEAGEAVNATLRAAASANARDCDSAIREIDEAVAALMRARGEVARKRGAA